MLNWEPIEHLSGLAPWFISDLLTDYNLVRLPRISQCAEEASAPVACSQLPADLRFLFSHVLNNCVCLCVNLWVITCKIKTDTDIQSVVVPFLIFSFSSVIKHTAQDAVCLARLEHAGITDIYCFRPRWAAVSSLCELRGPEQSRLRLCTTTTY